MNGWWCMNLSGVLFFPVTPPGDDRTVAYPVMRGALREPFVHTES